MKKNTSREENWEENYVGQVLLFVPLVDTRQLFKIIDAPQDASIQHLLRPATRSKKIVSAAVSSSSSACVVNLGHLVRIQPGGTSERSPEERKEEKEKKLKKNSGFVGLWVGLGAGEKKNLKKSIGQKNWNFFFKLQIRRNRTFGVEKECFS